MATVFLPQDAEDTVFSVEQEINKLMNKKRRVYSDLQHMCHLYISGNCNRESNCQYSHQKPEKKVCKHWSRGLCQLSERCAWIHNVDESRNEVCRFSREGKCMRDNCKFLHVVKEEVRECREYTKGFCEKGPKCRYYNGHYKKNACPKYMAGFCPKGPMCEDGHPKFELMFAGDSKMSAVQAHVTEEGLSKFVKKDVICFRCQQPGHMSAQCPLLSGLIAENAMALQNNKKLENVLCFKCMEKGHYANLCPNMRKPQPPGGIVSLIRAHQGNPTSALQEFAE